MGSLSDSVSCQEKKSPPSTDQRQTEANTEGHCLSSGDDDDAMHLKPQSACTPQIDVLRKRQNLTQQELAEGVGVTVTTISKWEQGNSGTETIRRFAQLCEALQCRIEDVVDATSEETLVPRIAELRKHRNLSQRELARSIGATEVTIANWEKGRSGLDWIERLIRLCDILDCSITDLLVYTEQAVREKKPPISEIIRRRRSGL